MEKTWLFIDDNRRVEIKPIDQTAFDSDFTQIMSSVRVGQEFAIKLPKRNTLIKLVVTDIARIE